jgi:hypothetical protein
LILCWRINKRPRLFAALKLLLVLLLLLLLLFAPTTTFVDVAVIIAGDERLNDIGDDGDDIDEHDVKSNSDCWAVME